MMVNWHSVQYKYKAKFGAAEAGLCLHHDLGGKSLLKVIKQPNTSQLITFGMHQLYLLSGIPVTGFRWPQSFYDYFFSLSHPRVILVLPVLSPSMLCLLCSDFPFCLTFYPVFSPSSFNLSVSLALSPDSASHQCPFLSVWLVPFLFTQMTLSPPCSFCLSGSPLPRCLQPLPVPYHTLYKSLLPLFISAFVIWF